MNQKEIGRRVRAARIDQRHEVKHAAKAAGVARSTWTRIEAGEGARDTTLRKVMEFLNLDDNGQRPGTSEEPVGQPGLQDASDVELLAEIARRLTRQADVPRSSNVADVEAWLAAKPMSVADVTVPYAVAAHEEEGSIAGEQEQDSP